MSAPRDTDIIRWVIDCMMAHEPAITPEQALSVEREARAEWGGQRVGYIVRTCAADRQAGPDPEALRQAVAANLPARQVASSAGISRRTLYRLIKR